MKELTYRRSESIRLDSFILKHCPGLGPGALRGALRENKVKLNGKKQPLATWLRPGDIVCLYLPDTAFLPPAPRVLYEDEHLLAADKPAGLPSLADGVADSMLARVRRYLNASAGDAAGPPGALPAACHRLDTGTSGVLLFAKTTWMLEMVAGLIRGKQLAKDYLAVTVGHPAPASGLLDGWLEKDAIRAQVRILSAARTGAKPVQTTYQTLAVSGALALLAVQPRTGRTHQIRAQLAHAGTPILGDSKYGQLAANRQLRCRYQCLCAHKLSFPASLPAGCETWAGLEITGAEPWFYRQMLDGELVL